MAKPIILVTGDHGLDVDIYRHSDEDNPQPGTPPTMVRASMGGAGLVCRVLQAAEASADNAFETQFAASTQAAPSPTVAVWFAADLGTLGASPADQQSKVWRTTRSVNLGRLDNPDLCAALAAQVPPSAARVHGRCDILLVEDDGAGVRTELPDPLATLLRGATRALPRHIVLKTCAPVGHGSLWWLLAGRQAVADRLLVIVSIDDLRRADVRISQGISWERTAEDLVRELAASPALSPLRHARHIVVTIGSEGALWMRRSGNVAAAPRATLVFDPSHMEDEWSRAAGVKGGAYGFHAVFSAAVACRLALDRATNDSDAIVCGIERGVLAMRAARVLGHGATKGADPGLPADDLGRLIAAGAGRTITGSAPLAWHRLGVFGLSPVPVEGTGGWRMLDATDPDLAGLPLYGKARRVAMLGTAALEHVPCVRFGKLVTADRDEIEALRNLKRLMDAYAESRAETRPLSLAVFGPPGAGKSFGIKQIAEAVIDDRRRAFLEFNLSQFDDPGDLTGALHQVRDKVLEGRLPVVFWDEFDSQDYRWLQYLLAPMQDGKFQEGQLTHPIGPCVFVFAGATSCTCEDFGPPARPASGRAADRDAHRAAVAAFRLKKGPDFKSRLHGSLNVVGPNPRQRFTGTSWEDDPADVCFPVRRAILLRSMLGLSDERHGAKRLDIDAGLLGALLEARYRHGSRSFEKIVDSLKRGREAGLRRSALPSDEVLEMNVENLPAFKAALDRQGEILPHAMRLAAAMHARWLGTASPKNRFAKAFDELPAETRGDNVAAALRIGDILALAGLELASKDDPRPPLAGVRLVLERHLETLAEEEHRGWMDVRLKNGWRRCDRSADANVLRAMRAARRSDCLVAYQDLPEAEREKDRDTIRWYPTAAALAGLKIVAKNQR
jgi:hypothetical protein